MTLLDAISCASKMLKIDYIDENYVLPEEGDEIASFLVDVTNLVCNEICSEYFKVRCKDTILPTSNVIEFADLSEDVFEIVDICTEDGKSLEYGIFPLQLEIFDKFVGNVVVDYYYVPSFVYNLTDNLNLDSRVTPRILAYGICSEYHLIKGNYDESLMFDKKFRDSMLAVNQKRNIYIPKRYWGK